MAAHGDTQNNYTQHSRARHLKPHIQHGGRIHQQHQGGTHILYIQGLAPIPTRLEYKSQGHHQCRANQTHRTPRKQRIRPYHPQNHGQRHPSPPRVCQSSHHHTHTSIEYSQMHTR